MAGPIAIASALSRLVRVTCPHRGYEELVERRPVAYRVCPRCHKNFSDPQVRAWMACTERGAIAQACGGAVLAASRVGHG